MAGKSMAKIAPHAEIFAGGKKPSGRWSAVPAKMMQPPSAAAST